MNLLASWSKYKISRPVFSCESFFSCSPFALVTYGCRPWVIRVSTAAYATKHVDDNLMTARHTCALIARYRNLYQHTELDILRTGVLSVVTGLVLDRWQEFNSALGRGVSLRDLLPHGDVSVECLQAICHWSGVPIWYTCTSGLRWKWHCLLPYEPDWQVVWQVSSFHLAVCLTTGPKPLPKRTLHIVRSRGSSFKWEYPLLSLRSSNSFLRLLPCLHVTSIPPCIFPSVIRCRRQFRRKMWPIQFAFRLRIPCRIFFCSLTLSNT